MRNFADALRISTASVRAVATSGWLRPAHPAVAMQIGKDLRRWGTSPAIGYAVGAARRGDDLAIIDVDDTLHPEVTFAEIEHRCNALARGLMDRGLGPESTVALLARNSRAFAEVVVAVSRIGADLVYLNTGASSDQIAHVLATEKVDLVVRDAEFAHLCPPDASWLGTDDPAGVSLLDSLPSSGALPAPERTGQHVILTTATAGGLPRGTARGSLNVDALATLLDVLPLRLGGTHLIAAPLFHAWGWSNHLISCTLGATEVLLRRSDPERILALIQAHEVDALITVPTVLARILALPERVRNQYDTSSLTCIAVSGSEMPTNFANEVMDTFGDVLYNLYGTTEAAFATVATPEDLREDSSTAGNPLPGVRVSVLNHRGRPVNTGEVGRVYVLSRTSFSGYTDGTDRDRVRGMVFTGDLGKLDEHGRLTLVGRADDVINSGGEKVHPLEVEQVLLQHAEVADVAVAGQSDNVYGAVVRAFVVPEDDVDDAASEQALIEHLSAFARTQLGPRHRPREYVIVDKLPRTASGKLRRRALVDPSAADDPEWL